MPYHDAKYPPAKVESDRMRLALTAIRDDCRECLALNAVSSRPASHLITAVWDCARTALGEGNQ